LRCQGLRRFLCRWLRRIQQPLRLARAAVYRKPAPVKEADLILMGLIDRLHLEKPFYGARKIAVVLSRSGDKIGRKRVTRLKRLMGIETIYRKPNLSRRHPRHKIYPYLLRNMAIDRVHQVWSCDITYIPMKQGFLYLVAVLDWHSRLVLSWRLSNTMDKTFCVEALQDAFERYGKPEIFNSDQGVQFTCEAFITTLSAQGIRISMDGKGRCLDNIFCERLWRSLKYEEVYLKAYVTVAEAKTQISNWFNFYNDQRPHQALSYHTPREFFAAATPVDMWTTQERALPTSSQAQQQQQSDSHDQEGLIHSLVASRTTRADVVQPGCRALS
jgi:putative transposase